MVQRFLHIINYSICFRLLSYLHVACSIIMSRITSGLISQTSKENLFNARVLANSRNFFPIGAQVRTILNKQTYDRFHGERYSDINPSGEALKSVV